jgi:arylsulfatase A-like enzyme
MPRRVQELRLALALCLLAACREAPTGPPNIILIVVDTLRADILISRRDLVDTPNIDALSADGVAFVSAFAHAPMTLPSHTALFSSRLPCETGVLCNGMDVPQDLPLLAEHLQKFGYQTRAVISLGSLWGAGPGKTLDRGFQSYDVLQGNAVPAPQMVAGMTRSLDQLDTGRPLFFFGHFCDPHEPYDSHPSAAAPDSEATLSLDGKALESVTTSVATYWTQTFELAPGSHRFDVRSEDETTLRYLRVEAGGADVPVRLTDAETGEPLKLARGVATRHATCDFENAEEERTFRITAWVMDNPSPEEGHVRYLEEVDFVDRYVGELVADLKRRGLYDHSIVVFTSDHGEALGDHGGGGHVETLFDELTHVPLIVKPALGAGKDALALRSRDVVRHLDLVPTLLQLANLPPLPGQRGTSLLADGQRPAVSETHRPEAKESQIAIRTDALKLIYYIEQDRFALYDMRADRGELHDVFARRGDEVLDWQEELRRMAALSEGTRPRLEDLEGDQLDRMRALGYFGDD